MEAGEHTFHKAAPVRTYRSSDSDGGVPRRRARSRHARSHSSDSQSYASGCGEGGATPLNGDATPHTAQRKTQRLLSSIRSYVPGQYRHGRSKYRRRRSGSAAQRSVSRITFVGEFGAGKSSVINTLLHVVSGSSPDEFTEAAPTGDGAQRQTQVADAYEVVGADARACAIQLFDFTGWERFNDTELEIMEEMRKYGVRERAQLHGAGASWDKEDVGEMPVHSHAFVWVFRLTAAASNGRRAAKRPSPSKLREKRHRRRGLVGTGPATAAAPGSLGGFINNEVSVTKKGLELSSEGRHTFQNFFAFASLHGMRPVVVLTHIDEFTPAQVAAGKGMVSYLTGVSEADIIGIRSYTSGWHRGCAETDFAAARIMDEALSLAERYEPSQSCIHSLDYTLYMWSLRARRLVNHWRYATTLRPILVLLFALVTVLLFVWCGLSSCQRLVCRVFAYAGRECPFGDT